MQSKVKVWLVCVVFSLITFTVCPPDGSGQIEPQKVACDVNAGPCSAVLAGSQVSLDINPKPVKAMEDLTFTLTFTGEKSPFNPYIDLGMPGMNMGRNRVMLSPAGESIFQGKGIIVRCPSGRRTWKAKVVIPERGSVEFVFDVIY